MLFYLSLGILILTFGASLCWRRSFGINRSGLTRICGYQYIFYGSVVLIFILLFYQSYQQYQFWSQNEVSKYLLPPHRSINYFIFYAVARFFAPYLISLAAAILFLISAKLLNKKYDERFFYPEEPYFGALAVFLTGHPGWLIYSALLIIIYLIIHIAALARNYADSNADKRGKETSGYRISMYYLWIPTAIFVILIQNYWLAQLPIWRLLEI
jgi:hypothetical protein